MSKMSTFFETPVYHFNKSSHSDCTETTEYPVLSKHQRDNKNMLLCVCGGGGGGGLAKYR